MNGQQLSRIVRQVRVALGVAVLAVITFPHSAWLLSLLESKPDGYTGLAAILAAGPLHATVCTVAIIAAIVQSVRAWRHGA